MSSGDVVRRLGSQYELSERVGRGGMGEVWRGTDAQGQPRAFKLLLPQFAQDPGILRRFLDERQLLASIRHPNVVGVHDLVIEGQTLAIVMDWVPGTDLRRFLREHGTLNSALACRILAQVCAGLTAIHTARIVHRDVKPENILLDLSADPMRVRLTDFGVSKVIDESATSTPTAIAGTPAYMAPEVLNGQLPTAQSDLYSLGIILYELLCGVTPFAGMSSWPMMQAHLTKDPGRPAGIDDRVWELIVQLLRKDPAQRPHDAALVGAQLDSLAQLTQTIPQLPKLATPPPSVLSDSPAAFITGTQVDAPRPADPPPAPAPGGPAAAPSPPVAQSRPGSFPQSGTTNQPMVWMTPMPGPSPVSAGTYPPAVASPVPIAYPQKQAKDRVPMLIGISIGLVVILAGLIAYLVMSGEPTDDPPVAQHSTEQPAVQWPPADAELCPGSDSVAVNAVTSCEFAANVADAFASEGEGDLQAYSPVTREYYTMSCSTTDPGVAVCSGGNDARVWIRY